MIKRKCKEFHEVGEMLINLEEGKSMEGSLMGRENTTKTTMGLEGDRDPPPLVDMEMLDGKGHLGSEGSPKDDMHFSIR